MTASIKVQCLPEEVILAAHTICAEARGESFDGKLAVGLVLRNRVLKRHRGETTLAGVCTEPWQFSCWNPGDPNRDKIYGGWDGKDIFSFEQCKLAAKKVFIDNIVDFTKGADHYHTKQMNPFPKWALGKTPCYTIGNHLFYNNID